METTLQNTQATACPNAPTADEVAEFFKAACLVLKAKTGNCWLSAGVTVTLGFGEAKVEWMTYADGCSHFHRPTFPEAFEAIVEAAGPVHKAARMRKEAEKLLAQACMLEGFAATALPGDVAAEVMPEGRQLPGKSVNIHE